MVRFVYRFALLVLAVWALAAIVGNSVAPPLEQVVADQDQPVLPFNSPTALAVQRSAAAFGQAPTDNVEYLVLSRDGGTLDERDRLFYDQLLAALRADPQHVYDITDGWRVPATAEVAMSDDHRVVTAPMRLMGMVGTTEAVDSITVARAIAAQLRPPDGLQVYITGAGATIMDEYAAIDRQTQVIMAITVAVLLVLLSIMYRSLITALVPLASVLTALTVAKPIVSELVDKQVFAVTQFSLSVSVAVVVGAGTGFAMFLIGRYHEARRYDLPPDEALIDAYRGVAPTIMGSALIIVVPVGAAGFLSLATISIFATTGILCSLGILIAAVAALTLTPAIVALASRVDLLKPPQSQRLRRRWRRIGVRVARWPAPILVTAGIFVLILMIGLPGVPIGWDETATTSATAPSSRGYQVVDQHFPPNQLFPDVVTIETDTDLRNPDGLNKISQVTGALMAISGVRMVQSASHPGGLVSKQAALTTTAGNLGDRLDEFSDLLTARAATFGNLQAAVNDLRTGLDLIQSGTRAGSYAIGGVSLAVHLTQESVTKIRARSADVTEIFDPLNSFVGAIADCRTTPVCAAAQEAVGWARAVVDGSTVLVDQAEQLAKGVADAAAAAAPPDLPNVLSGIGIQMIPIRASAAALTSSLNEPRPVPTADMPDYLHQLAAVSQGSPSADLYASRRILTDPATRPALADFYSTNGHATRLYVYGNGHEWGDEGAVRARAIVAAVTEATKNGTIRATAFELTGVGPATRDLEDLVGGGLLLIAVITLAVILVVAAVLLRSPIAGIIVLGTIATSYVCALGASVLFWQRLLNHELHWSVPPIAFVSMVGIASGGNLLFALRIREGLSAGLRTSIIRAFAAMGMIVTAGGFVVGISMLALATSSVLSLAQIGVTVGLGLLVNALLVRAFVLPAIMVVLDRWLWWPRTPVSDRQELETVPA